MLASIIRAHAAITKSSSSEGTPKYVRKNTIGSTPKTCVMSAPRDIRASSAPTMRSLSSTPRGQAISTSARQEQFEPPRHRPDEGVQDKRRGGRDDDEHQGSGIVSGVAPCR